MSDADIETVIFFLRLVDSGNAVIRAGFTHEGLGLDSFATRIQLRRRLMRNCLTFFKLRDKGKRALFAQKGYFVS
jgi:hypothetical protein